MRRSCCAPSRAERVATSNSATPWLTSTCRGTPWRSNSASAASIALARIARYSYSIWSRAAHWRNRCWHCWRKRSRCLSWLWARLAPFSAASRRNASSLIWCWRRGCKRPMTPAPGPSARSASGSTPQAGSIRMPRNSTTSCSGRSSRRREGKVMGALRDFVADLLDSEGAVIEHVEPDGLDVLAPEQLRTTMGWPELARLGFGAQLPPGAMPIGLEGDWLDRFGALLGDRGRFAERQLVLPVPVAPPSDPERRLNGVLDLRNAIWRLRDARPVMTRCLLLAFRYTATSDERREGLIWLGFNTGTGTVLEDDMVDRLRHLLANNMEWRAPDPDALPQAGAASDASILAERARA